MTVFSVYDKHNFYSRVMEQISMICIGCNVDKSVGHFRKLESGNRRKKCLACEHHALKLRRDRGEKDWSESCWHLPRRAWPWPPGVCVFEDVKLRGTNATV